jgi:hypothetical protein
MYTYPDVEDTDDSFDHFSAFPHDRKEPSHSALNFNYKNKVKLRFFLLVVVVNDISFLYFGFSTGGGLRDYVSLVSVNLASLFAVDFWIKSKNKRRRIFDVCIGGYPFSFVVGARFG